MPKYGVKDDWGIFSRYTLDELARRMGYAPMTLLKIREGTDPLTDRFKRRASLILGEAEEMLFAPVGAAGTEEGNGSDSR